MKFDAFYAAAIPDPVTVLGLKLKPYSLGHVLLLHRVESAFVCGGNITYDDLALSVFLCAHSYRDGVEALDSPDLSTFMGRWVNKLLKPTWRHKLGLKKPEVINVDKKAEEFARYIEAGSRMPSFAVDAEKSGVIEVPSVQLIKVGLMRETSLTEAEILDRPYGLCIWDFLTVQAVKGLLTFVDGDYIREVLEYGRQVDAEREASQQQQERTE